MPPSLVTYGEKLPAARAGGSSRPDEPSAIVAAMRAIAARQPGASQRRTLGFMVESPRGGGWGGEAAEAVGIHGGVSWGGGGGGVGDRPAPDTPCRPHFERGAAARRT